MLLFQDEGEQRTIEQTFLQFSMHPHRPTDSLVFQLAFSAFRKNIGTPYMDAQVSQSAGLIKFQAWFELNKKRVFIGAIIAIVVGVAVFLAINYQSKREDRASQALSE